MNNYLEMYGNTVLYSDSPFTAPGTELAGIAEIPTMPMETVDQLEITRVNQADRYKQFVGTMIDAGECNVKIGFDKTQYGTVQGLVGVNKGWQIKFNDGSTLVFEGNISKAGPTSTGKFGEVLQDVTVKVSGAVVYTPAI